MNRNAHVSSPMSRAPTPPLPLATTLEAAFSEIQIALRPLYAGVPCAVCLITGHQHFVHVLELRRTKKFDPVELRNEHGPGLAALLLFASNVNVRIAVYDTQQNVAVRRAVQACPLHKQCRHDPQLRSLLFEFVDLAYHLPACAVFNGVGSLDVDFTKGSRPPTNRASWPRDANTWAGSDPSTALATWLEYGAVHGIVHATKLVAVLLKTNRTLTIEQIMSDNDRRLFFAVLTLRVLCHSDDDCRNLAWGLDANKVAGLVGGWKQPSTDIRREAADGAAMTVARLINGFDSSTDDLYRVFSGYEMPLHTALGDHIATLDMEDPAPESGPPWRNAVYGIRELMAEKLMNTTSYMSRAGPFLHLAHFVMLVSRSSYCLGCVTTRDTRAASCVLKRCGGCRVALYCSAACQSADFRRTRGVVPPHSQVCGTLARFGRGGKSAGHYVARILATPITMEEFTTLLRWTAIVPRMTPVHLRTGFFRADGHVPWM